MAEAERQLDASQSGKNPDTLQVPSPALCLHRPHRYGGPTGLTHRSSATRRTYIASPHSPPWPPGTTTSARQGSHSDCPASRTWADGVLFGPTLWKHPSPRSLRALGPTCYGVVLGCRQPPRWPEAGPGCPRLNPAVLLHFSVWAGLVSVSMCSEPSSGESSLCWRDRAASQKRAGGVGTGTVPLQ